MFYTFWQGDNLKKILAWTEFIHIAADNVVFIFSWNQLLLCTLEQHRSSYNYLFIISCDQQTKTLRLMSHNYDINRESIVLGVYHWTILILFKWTLGWRQSTIFPDLYNFHFFYFLQVSGDSFLSPRYPPCKVLRSAFALVVSNNFVVVFRDIIKAFIEGNWSILFPMAIWIQSHGITQQQIQRNAYRWYFFRYRTCLFQILLVGDSHVNDHSDAIVNSLKAILPQNKDIKFYKYHPTFNNKARQKSLIDQLFQR